MHWLRKLTAWLRGQDVELVEELETHRALVEDELRNAGLSHREAAAESRRRMGNMTLAREDAREVWVIRWIDRLGQHLRYGIRGLRREPGFAFAALVTLALGTAATTTVFSVVDAELWRPLPYPAPERLLAVGSRDPKTNAADGITIGELQEWRQRATALESLTAVGRLSHRIAQLDSAASLRTTEVTSSYFTTLGRRAIVGRVFSAEDPPAIDGVVLTERAWSRVFDSDPAIIGKTFALDDQPVTIVGVVANDDSMGLDGDLYLAINERSAASTPGPFYTMIGRLAPGASATVVIEQLQAAIDDQARTNPARLHHRAVAEGLSDYYQTTNAGPLYFFLGASALVLLLTIANVASLVVARAVRRTPEFAVRNAIGGGTRTLAAQLAAESALIAVPGCLAGLVLTNAALSGLGQFVPNDFLYRGTRIAVDLRVLGFTIFMAAATTACLALVSLGIVRRIGERAALGASHRTTGSPAAARMRHILLTGQLALTLTLLAGAGVFVKSFVALTQVPLGFEPANAWSIQMTLAGPRFANGDALRAYADTVVERVKGVPGIQHAAVATTSPLRSGWLATVTPSPAGTDQSAPLRTIFRSVGPEYFRAVGTTVIRGRGITADDRQGTPIVAVVNEEFVRRMFGTDDAIGRTVEFVGNRAPAIGSGIATIVGVVTDIKQISLNEVAMPDLYLPFAQRPAGSLEFLVRGHGSDPAMSSALRAAVADPFVPVTFMGTLQDRVDRALQRERFHLIVVALFAALAVLTASIGVYGAMAYAVTARWREFGVRLALGASPRTLVGGTLSQAARLGLISGGVGLAFALLLARWIGDALYLVPGKHNGLLYNTTTTDPVALTGALVAILLLSLAAAAIPARRASRIDPVQALRAD
jgi:putative ABC transport system permease protein